MFDLLEVLTLVLKFFDGNEPKAKLWLETKNPLLGGVTPLEMIEAGRCDKLLEWVKQQIADGEKPDA